MDMNTLIDQIIARVAEKVAETGEAVNPCACTGKPRLLILAQEHGTCCHEMLESPRLTAHFDIACALNEDYRCDAADYDAVILYGLTVEALSKLASGACDTPFTALASKALLLGKRVYVPTEEVELYRYASTAPAAYYAMMEEKLKLLLAAGVVICAQANLENAVLGAAPAPCGPCSPISAAPCVPAKEIALTKRVITERDIISAKENGATRVSIGTRAILTDLAKDMAKHRGVAIVRV